ncbi:MAG: hypothetical protein R3F34_10340 [Planctomycetota bacterium]
MQRYPVPCTPPFYARGGHAQTVLGHVLLCSAPRIGEVAGWRASRSRSTTAIASSS